jgi:ribosomal protein S14
MNNKFINGLTVALLIFLPFPLSVYLSFVAFSFLVAEKNSYAIIFAVISAALIITAVIAINLHSKRCKRCGKWNALQVIKVEEFERQKVTIKKILEETHRNVEGEVIETVEKEVLAPAIRVYYRVNKRCKFCGRIRQGVKIETFS